MGGEEVDVERWAEGVGWPTREARPIDLLATGEERIVPPVEAIIASPEQNPRNALVWVQVGPCTSDDTKRRYRFAPEGEACDGWPPASAFRVAVARRRTQRSSSSPRKRTTEQARSRHLVGWHIEDSNEDSAQ